jgi:thymidylate synthase (FAD)
MQVIKPYWVIEFDGVDVDDPVQVYKKIERIARCCYKSEEKIDELSHEKMLSKLIDLGHLSMLEHHTVVIEVLEEVYESIIRTLNCEYQSSGQAVDVEEYKRVMRYLHFSKFVWDDGKTHYVVSGSPTAFSKVWQVVASSGESIERLCAFVHNIYPRLVKKPERASTWNNLMLYSAHRLMETPEVRKLPYHVRRHHEMITVRFVCDRGVSHELVRHRAASYAQESTRYVNYGKRGCQFILPCWFTAVKEGIYRRDGKEGVDLYYKSDENAEEERIRIVDLMSRPQSISESKEYVWLLHCLEVSRVYEGMVMRKDDKPIWSPQQARSILPNATKTEIYVSMTVVNWEWFFKMRDSKSAHPQMQELATSLHEEFVNCGYLEY